MAEPKNQYTRWVDIIRENDQTYTKDEVLPTGLYRIIKTAGTVTVEIPDNDRYDTATSLQFYLTISRTVHLVLVGATYTLQRWEGDLTRRIRTVLSLPLFTSGMAGEKNVTSEFEGPYVIRQSLDSGLTWSLIESGDVLGQTTLANGTYRVYMSAQL